MKIVACAREPGARSKIAVTSRDADVDPVGACVGMKGARVQAVVQELRGEKIDIVPFDRDPARFVCAAIQPAEVSKVIVDEADGRMELVVPDEKLSLAIGRKGQNVRLAAQLSGWKLDIISDTKFKQMEEEAVTQLQQIEGVSEAIARSMYRLGFRTLEELAEASEQELASIPGLGGAEIATRIRTSAEATMERLRQDRIQAASSRTEPLTERERLLFIRGVGERTVQLLEDAGYRTVEDILREEEDKLAIKTGLGIKKARAIKQGAEHFLSERREDHRGRATRGRRQGRARPRRSRRAIEGEAEHGTVETQMTSRPNRERHAAPTRTCVGCGEQRAMPRSSCVSSSKAARWSFDLAGGAFGRGAHVHARPACLAARASRPLRGPSSATSA